jgi:outer membrane protein assembly factor BamE
MRIYIVFIAAFLASCSILPTFSLYKVEIRQGNLITADMRAKIKVGMTQAQVKAALGSPLINDPFHANRWDYFYSLNKQGKLEGSQRLTLYFDGDVLKRIDDATPLLAPAIANQE